MMQIRKTVIIKETIATDEMGRPCPPITRVAAMAVVKNPFAGRDEDDLSALFDMGAKLGENLAGQIVGLLAAPAVSYGKAAIVGISGVMEHGAGIVHPRLGKPMRESVGGGAALIPANVKVAALGAQIDLPLGHKDNPWSFDHIDTMTLMIADAPRPDEIVVCIAVSDGPRACPRVGNGPAKPG